MPLSTVSRALCYLAMFSCMTLPAQAAETRRPIKQMRYLLGTLCEIVVFPLEQKPPAAPSSSVADGARQKEGPDSVPSGPRDETDQANDAIAAAFAELKRIDRTLSNWRADSELMRMNLAAGAPGRRRPWVSVSEELFDRLRIALGIARNTAGAFDPTVGPLVRAWGFLPPCVTENPCKPRLRSDALKQAQSRVGWQKVRLEPRTRQVQFAVSGMEIDLGGIAKGYAAARAAAVLRAHGVTSAMVNLGGSSIVAIGAPPADAECGLPKPPDADHSCARGWTVLVRDPRDGKTPVAAVVLRDGESLATSGTYERTTGAGRQRRSHIIDPLTGRAVGGNVSVTVLTGDAETADALTKPFFLLSAREQTRLLSGFRSTTVLIVKADDRTLSYARKGRDPGRFLTGSMQSHWHLCCRATKLAVQ